jgi:signal peptidase II
MKRCQTVVFAALLLVPVGCDCVSKQIAHEVLADSPGVSFAADTLRFQLTSNPGAFLNLGAGLPSGWRHLILLGLVPLLLAALCAVALRSAAFSGWSLLGPALVVGGGLANWLDRLQHGGAVTDFVSFGLGPFRTGVFNLADASIMAGVALLLLARKPRQPRGEVLPGESEATGGTPSSAGASRRSRDRRRGPARARGAR